MKTKSRRIIPIWMIIGGLVALSRYLLNWDASKDNTYNIIIILCVIIYITTAVIALRNSITTPGNAKE